MRTDKIIVAIFLFSFVGCRPFTEISTKDQYKKTWTGRQFRKHSCIRWVRETITDTVANYVIQRTKEKRQICGYYGWPIKSVTTTYNKDGKPIERHIVKRGRFDTKKANKTIPYPQNYDGLTEEQVKLLKDALNKFD